jgi:transmembrane sensor
MEKSELTALIQKYLAGKCTPQEEEFLHKWWENALQDNSYLTAISDAERQHIKHKMLKNIHALIKAPTVQDSSKNDTPPVPMPVKATFARRNRFYLQLAACLVVIIIAAVGLFVKYNAGAIHITTAYGERREITLPDGSTVVLNGNSSLQYSRWKENEDRHLALQGEAFFSVKHTTNHNRFIVSTPDNLTIEVLGTQFSVNNRKEVTNVVLSEGEVKLADARNSYIMKPDEMVSYSKQQGQFIASNVNARQKISWKDNLLIFRDEPIGDIIESLRESHGLKVIFHNEALKQEVFNGSVPGDSVHLFFDKINKLYHIKVERDDNGTYILN